MSQTLSLNEKETNSNSSLNTKAVADADTTTEVMHALVNAAIAGSGTASARMYTEFSPDNSGEFEVAVDYFRDADMYLGTGKLFAFMRDDFGGLEKFELEVLKGGAKGTVTRSADIELDASTTYDIGFEVYATGGTTGAVSIADFYNSKKLPPGIGPRHRVELNEFRIRSK